MARKAILETEYTFTPGASGVGKVVIPRAIPRERLVLITNVNTNTVIYNFSDSNLGATDYQLVTSSSGQVTTTVTFKYDTASMTSTQKLQIIVDEYDEKFTPSETYLDSVNRFRVSQPQALIDTDFEYGTQTTKWENLGLVNNRPFAFSSNVAIATVSSMSYPTNSKTVTVTLQSGSIRPGIGTAIIVQDSFLSPANGSFIVDGTPSATTFTYSASQINNTTLTSIFDSNKTGIFTGTTYSSAGIGTSNTFGWTASNATEIPVTTSVPHGLAIGNEVAVVGTSQTVANGSFIVARVNTSTQFTYFANGTPSANPTGGTIYVRPSSQFLHRPFDGGVIFSSNGSGNFEQAIRQTRRYFRYQSGKGLMISSGTILKPNLQLDSIVSSGTTVTVKTKEQHNIQPGTNVTIVGAAETQYNGSFTINDVTGFNEFKYTAQNTPSATPASGSYSASINSWYGCVNRLGAYDFQNGLFFEFDGQTLYAVRRSSTYQLAGKVDVTSGSNTVTGSSAFPTYLAKQLDIGDYVVIRGQSYRVNDISSDTSISVTPSYRGATATNVVISRTVDTKIPQSQWNIDKCDGTGPSGFNLNLSKMQMFYIDYSWYGAGFIRWGFRGPDGNVIYAHKMPNNNLNTEAYMRSGNLPGRYESSTIPPYTKLTSTINNTVTTIGIASTAGFPSSGTVLIKNAAVYEYVNYTGIGTTALNGVTRARAGIGSTALTISSGSNLGTVSAATTASLQVGMRVTGVGLGTTAFPDGTFISNISGTNIRFSQSALATNPTIKAVAMGVTAGQSFTVSTTDPVAVELAYPTFSSTISHWGTSVIMDGRYDDDKSLVFTYGQKTATTIPADTSRALFSIRIAPSVDNSIGGSFGSRELINRMQLILRGLDISTRSGGATSLLVEAYLNAIPSTTTNWTNAVGNVPGRQNSSFAQIADYSGGTTTVSGGEVTAGFFVSGTTSIDLSQVRDLGNSVLGGGGLNSRSEIFPDGPDTLTIVVTNLSTGQNSDRDVFGRLSWTEAQA